MADRAQNNKILQAKYLDIVYNSRNKDDINSEIAAANAITILNLSHFSFSNLDLSGIRIKGADLAGGEFVNTDLSNTDLSGVNFRSSILTNAKFIGANM